MTTGAALAANRAASEPPIDREKRKNIAPITRIPNMTYFKRLLRNDNIREDRGVYRDGCELFLGGIARCMTRDNRRPHGTPKNGKAQLKRVAVALSVERMYMTDQNGLVLRVETRFRERGLNLELRRTLPELQNDGKGQNSCRRPCEYTGKSSPVLPSAGRAGWSWCLVSQGEIIITLELNRS
jgi:hypothetical protein